MPESQPQRRTIGELADTNPEALGAGADPRARFKYVDLSSVTSGAVAWNLAPEFTLLTAPSRARRVLRRGDVLFGTVRPNLQSHGYVDWAGDIALVGSTGFSVIRTRAGVSDPRYLFHCVMSSGITAQANRDAVGSSYPALNDSDVRRFEVFAPPVDEQAAVAHVLDTLDTTIRQTEAIIEKLKQVKQGLLHDLLTRGIDANGELRPAQSQAPHRYKDSPLGWIPREWSVGTLAQMAESLDGKRVPVNSEERSKRVGDVPYYGANGQQGVIDTWIFNEPLILLAEDGGNFDEFETRPIAYRIDGPSWVNNHAHVLRAVLGVDQTFLFFSLEHKDIRRYISGGTRTKLTMGELRQVELPHPPESEQRLIGERLEALTNAIKAEWQARDSQLALKSGLMDDLLTGRVRVTPLLA